MKAMEEQSRILGTLLEQEVASELITINAQLGEHTAAMQDNHTKVELMQISLSEAVAKIAETTLMEDTKKEVKKSIETMNEHAEVSTTAASSAPPEVPQELRTVARMGNIGAPANAEQIEARFAHIFENAGFDMNKIKFYSSLKSDGGNMAEIGFAEPMDLWDARSKIQRARLALPGGGGKPVWLNHKRTQKETAPRRITHRAFDKLAGSKASRRLADRLSKVPAEASILVDDEAIAYANGSQLFWTSVSENHFEAELKAMVKAFAELP